MFSWAATPLNAADEAACLWEDSPDVQCGMIFIRGDSLGITLGSSSASAWWRAHSQGKDGCLKKYFLCSEMTFWNFKQIILSQTVKFSQTQGHAKQYWALLFKYTTVFILCFPPSYNKTVTNLFITLTSKMIFEPKQIKAWHFSKECISPFHVRVLN